MKRSRNDFKNYEYVLLYVNNVLDIGYNPTEFLQNIDKYFGLNPVSLSNPNIYLIAKLNMVRMKNWVVVCSLSLS